MAPFHFKFVLRNGEEADDEDVIGCMVQDYFDCDLDTADLAELVASYKGPDCDGIGVVWEEAP